ncbi:MAG TPA: cytochrome c maturation protein CcmE [Gaiellaceae bacterium]|nr:cytochrome c maturation protein CcmE [Gaiellaceae bacterium]
MARSRRSPARLVIALAIAALLAVFLVYTALSGTTPALQPSNLAGHNGTVSLTGKVIGPVKGDAHLQGGLRFKLHNINGVSPTVPIIYHGSVPDLFEVGRDVNVTGQLQGASFVATALTTKCPSKYTSKA